MVVCQVASKPELYGLGIRLAFYIQWLAAIVVDYLDETRLADIRLVGILLSSATTLSLIVQVANNKISSAEIYVVLLLAFGVYVYIIPLFVWRALTLCNPYWNPRRYSKERPSPIFRICDFLLLVAIAGLAVWFFLSYLPDHNDLGCNQYGYLFGKIVITSGGYIAVNAIIFISILIGCSIALVVATDWEIAKSWFGGRHKRRKVHRSHVEALRNIRALFNFPTFGAVVAGVELTLQWNHLKANDVGTVAQLIPLILSAGLAVRVLFLYFAGGDDDDDSSEDERHYHHRHHHHHHRRSSHQSRRSGPQTETVRVHERVVLDNEAPGVQNWGNMPGMPPPAVSGPRRVSRV